MISETLKKFDALVFETTKTEPALEVGVRKYRTWNAADGLDFQVAIFGNGFEASHNLNRDELIAIRDWINDALVASEMERA
jgi:hypothetical protein